MLTDFQTSFTGRLAGKFATNAYSNIPPHLKYVATLPCEMNVRKLVAVWNVYVWLMINHKIALPSIYVMMGYFITNLSFIVLVKDCKHLAKLHAKRLIMPYAPFASDFCTQRCRTRWISEITCLLRTETVTDCCYVNREINVSLLSTNIKLL